MPDSSVGSQDTWGRSEDTQNFRSLSRKHGAESWGKVPTEEQGCGQVDLLSFRVENHLSLIFCEVMGEICWR